MSDLWLSTAINDFIEIGKSLHSDDMPVFCDLLSWNLAKQVSLAQADVVILYEQISGTIINPQNSNMAYRQQILFNVHVFATRIQNAARNLEAVAGTSERLIKKLVHYSNPVEKIANCALSVPPVMFNISGIEGVGQGSSYMQFQFSFTKTISYL